MLTLLSHIHKHNNNKKGRKKIGEVMNMSVALAVVMFLRVYIYPQIHQIRTSHQVCKTYFTCESYFN